jgi:hypothetical protein
VRASDPDRDPFAERASARWHARYSLLGGRFRFTSNSRRLLQLVDAAYRHLPMRSLSGPGPTFEIELRLSKARTLRGARTPPRLKTFSGAGGLLGGIMDAANFVLLAPAARAALVAVSRDMLDLPYHLRYELIEFAVYTLASRAQGLLSLHAACVGRAGLGLLLMGESGAGKSTLALHSALQGLQFLSEDAAFVDPSRLLLTGVPNFVHVRPDAVAGIEQPAVAARVRRSAVIHRRSGTAKFEVDLRRFGARLGTRPLKLAAVVFLSGRHSGPAALLRALPRREVLRRFRSAQPYATLLPGWRAFRRAIDRVPGFELRRGPHPLESVVALSHLLAQRAAAPGA